MISWSEIDTVLLDMDGTLLDLNFDNVFWQQVVPEHYAKKHQLDIDVSKKRLQPIFDAQEGQLNWYCLDYWTTQLELDIVQLKREIEHQIEELPHTRAFLHQLKVMGKRTILVTNAHAEALSLKMKKTGLIGFFDAMVSTHDFGYPKEHPSFWAAFQRLEAFDEARTLLVDDSVKVLKSAQQFGLVHLVAISKPDSQQPSKEINDFLAVDYIDELIP